MFYIKCAYCLTVSIITASLTCLLPQAHAGKVISGYFNQAEGTRAAVVAGKSNSASAGNSLVGAGQDNTATGYNATILGGAQNTATTQGASVLTGYQNANAGRDSAILSGGKNQIQLGAVRSSVLAGSSNTIESSAWSSFIGAGYNNSNAGDKSAILMGSNNIIGAGGDNTLVAGVNASSDHKNSFVFNTDSSNPLATTDDGQFLVNATGGAIINGRATIQGNLSLTGGLQRKGGVVMIGEKGEPGPQGPTGDVGQGGLDGADGSDGVGVSDADINANGDLILTLTNGSIINAGSVGGGGGASSSWRQIGSDIDGDGANISADGNTVGVRSGDTALIYSYNGSSWQQLGEDVATGLRDYFEGALSADGKTAAVGFDNGLDSEFLRVYRYNGSSWQQLGDDFNPEAGFISDISTSYDGNTIALSSEFYDNATSTYSEYVCVYRWNGSSWQQIGAKLVGDYSEPSISADGNTLAVSSELEVVRVYGYDGSSWQQLGSDIRDDIYELDEPSISDDGKTLAVEAEVGDEATSPESGFVRVYRYNGSSWQQLGADISDEAYVELDDPSISGDGNTIAVDLESYNDAAGAYSEDIRVYRYNGSSWQQLGADILFGGQYADQN
jgi:hypothetical protein